MKKRKIRSFLAMALSISLCLTAFSTVCGPASAAETTDGVTTVSVPWNLINKCGHQAFSGPCQAYCFAYCRTILDGKYHGYTEYWINGVGAVSNAAAGYNDGVQTKSVQELLKVVYDNVNMGRPLILRVDGQNGSWYHWVVAIGYKTNCDPNNLKTSDILILDPASKIINASKGTTPTYTYLSSCKINGNSYRTPKSGGTKVESGPITESYKAVIARPSEGFYNLVPACAPNSALDVENKRTDNEANLHIWQAYTGLTSQQWRLERVDGDYYTIKNENSGRVASIEHNYTTKGSTVWQYGYGASNAQKWRFEDAGDGYYYIVPKQNTDLCLDVSGASSENGTNVQVYTKNYTDAQKWKLVPVEKPVPTYTVYFDANGGKVSQTSKTVTEGELIGAMPEPSRKGYEFQFWGSEREGTCMVVTPNNLYIFKDTTLYAHWKKVEPTPTPEPEWKEGWDKLKDTLTEKNDKTEEEPLVTPTPEPEPPVTISPEPEQKVESTLKIKGLTATITDKGIGVTCTVNSNYELTDFSDELRDANGIGRSFGMGHFGKGKTEDELEIEYRFGRLWKKGTYVVTVKVEDTSGRKVNASVTIELPFDINGEGRPVKK